jgi:CBS domain-containing membrane protein
MIASLFRRLRPFLVSDVSPLSLGEKLRSSLAAFFAILALGLVSAQFISAGGLAVMVASMGASAVLLFAMPKSPLAQPWPMVGGNLIAMFMGITCARLVADPWLASACAVALAILAMHLTHSLHPPGGALALVAVLGDDAVRAKGYAFLVAPVGLNVLLLLVLAVVINNLLPGHGYPTGPRRKDSKHRHDDPTPLARLGLDRDDLRLALRDLDTYLDVSEADLDRVYAQAGVHAFRRKMGNITCGDIMSRDLVTVEYGTDLEEAWALLRYHKIRALPVVDPFRRVIGVITLVDFLKRAELKTYATFKDKLIEFIRPTPGAYTEKPEVVGQIMAAPVRTVSEGWHIVDLVPMLADQGLHHVPVVDADKRLVGMITQSDLIAALYTGDVMRAAGAPERP